MKILLLISMLLYAFPSVAETGCEKLGFQKNKIPNCSDENMVICQENNQSFYLCKASSAKEIKEYPDQTGWTCYYKWDDCENCASSDPDNEIYRYGITTYEERDDRKGNVRVYDLCGESAFCGRSCQADESDSDVSCDDIVCVRPKTYIKNPTEDCRCIYYQGFGDHGTSDWLCNCGVDKCKGTIEQGCADLNEE